MRNFCTQNTNFQPQVHSWRSYQPSHQHVQGWNVDLLKRLAEMLLRREKEGCSASGADNSTNTLHLKLLLWLSIGVSPWKRKHPSGYLCPFNTAGWGGGGGCFVFQEKSDQFSNLQPNFSPCSCTPPNQAFSALSGRLFFITSSVLSQRVTVHCLPDAISHHLYYCLFTVGEKPRGYKFVSTLLWINMKYM